MIGCPFQSAYLKMKMVVKWRSADKNTLNRSCPTHSSLAAYSKASRGLRNDLGNNDSDLRHILSLGAQESGGCC